MLTVTVYYSARYGVQSAKGKGAGTQSRRNQAHASRALGTCLLLPAMACGRSHKALSARRATPGLSGQAFS